jgi:hypothetical protein
MKKFIKYIPYIAVALIALVAAIIRPWQYISFVPVIGQNSALTVKTIAGKAEIHLNDKKIGETPLSSENLSPGDFELTLKRLSETDEFYDNLTTQIHLESNTRTFVEAEIGPSEQFSSLTVLYYKKNMNDSSGLYLDTNPQKATVWIDDIRQGTSPVTTESLEEGRHDLKVTHPGYEDVETTLIIRKGYTLIADVRLMAKPIELD